MESKDLMIIVLAVLVVILAIIAVAAFTGGDDNLDDTNVTNDTDDGGVNIIIAKDPSNDNSKNNPVTPKKNSTEPYVVDRYWSEQQGSYISVYSNGSHYIEATGAWLEDIS